MPSSTHLAEALSRGADVTIDDFSAFLDMRRCKNLGL